MEGDPVLAVDAGAVAVPANDVATTRSDKARRLPEAWTGRLRSAAILGAVVTAVGAILDPVGAGTALLVASQYVLGLGLGGLVFVVLAYLTGAGWSVAFRRVPEVLAATIPLGAGLTLMALVFLPWLYEWSHPEIVLGDPILESKSAWLDPSFFVLRAFVTLGIWIFFSRLILRNSSRQDLDADVRWTKRNTVLSALFMVVFAITFSLATFDWMMSLEPHWYSTVYAVYNFSGMFTSALAAILIVAILLRRAGPLRHVLRDDHLHDLGKLLFGFATFWAYIWFCQYMLIWYANIPEETAYFTLRSGGAWSVLTLLNVVVNWAIPFIVLLPRPAKRSEAVLLKVAALLLIGRWLDLYLMIAPVHAPDGPRPTLWDLSAMMMAVALLVLFLARIFARVRLVPQGDPMLEESLAHHI